MYRIIVLILQKFLWSKLLKGRLKSKIFSILLILTGLVLLGGFFASQYMDMSFVQGVWWAWEYLESFFVKSLRFIV
jgi:hypothetical protein